MLIKGLFWAVPSVRAIPQFHPFPTGRDQATLGCSYPYCMICRINYHNGLTT